MKRKIEFDYIRNKDGSSEFVDFLESIPKKDQAKLLTIIENTEIMGLQTAIKMQWVKKLDNNLYELRSRVGTNIQRAIYFQKQSNNYLITHGFTKKSQKTPIKEINHAIQIRNNYERNERDERNK